MCVCVYVYMHVYVSMFVFVRFCTRVCVVCVCAYLPSVILPTVEGKPQGRACVLHSHTHR